jgi:hypothetical protein
VSAVGILASPVALLVPDRIPLVGLLVPLVVVLGVAWLVSLLWRLVADRASGVPLGRLGLGILVATETGYAVRTRRGIVATFDADALVTVARPNVFVASLTFDRPGGRLVRLDVTSGWGADDDERAAQQLAVEVLEARAREQWRRWS